MTKLGINKQSIVFFLYFLAATLAFIYIIHSLLSPIFYGVVFAIVLYPVYKHMANAFKRETPAALITIILAVIVLAVLLYVIGGLIVSDAVHLFETVSDKIENLTPQLQDLVNRLRELLPPAAADQINSENIKQQIINSVKGLTQGVFQTLQGFIGNIVGFILFALVTFYSTFFFLKYGKQWSRYLFMVLPLPDEEEKYLTNNFIAITRAAFRIIFVMGAVQGILGGLIFWLLGVPSPFFWGLIFAIASLIPGLGHQLVWIPAAIIFFIIGEPLKGIILIPYGMFVMGLADDLLRPYLIGKSAQINTFLILIATIGGIATLGFTGLILGPIVASLTMAFWKLYEKRYAG